MKKMVAIILIIIVLFIALDSAEPLNIAAPLSMVTADVSSIISGIEPILETEGDADESTAKKTFVLSQFIQSLPEYGIDPGIELNNNRPLFSEEDYRLTGVSYSELDELGRCGSAIGMLGPETLPTEERGPIGEIKPTGWHTVRYDDRIEDRYLFNRCHLIGYQLAGDNADPRNLITGTRYLNIVGMLPFENEIWGYITETNNHVLYRVTPVFVEDNLLASGVLMEAFSIEDQGTGIEFFTYLFNVQPGVVIDYKTGESYADEAYEIPAQESDMLVLLPTDLEAEEPLERSFFADDTEEAEVTYVLNLNTKRFHDPSCPSVEEMSEKNRFFFYGTREEAIELGYVPCGRCKP